MNKSKKNSEFENFKSKIYKELKKEYGNDFYPFWGNQNAKIVSISQAPSLSVIRTQKPFNDKSGEKLRRKWLKTSDEFFYNPDNFYFTVISRFFPGKDKRGSDKKPNFKWADKWLWEELSYLNPELFLIVGKVAADFIYPKNDFLELVMKNQSLNGKLALVLPHPSPVNIKWFMDHPQFEEKRLPYIRKYIHKILKT